MTVNAARSGASVAIPADQVDYLIGTAARAPSIHNTQPWRFRVERDAIGLYADPSRRLRVDPIGREMLISCGAALFGLRLAVRSLGYIPVVETFPDRAKLRLLARVRLGGRLPASAVEREMLQALPHRHTHRGAFEDRPLPAGLTPALQHDALAEGATLAFLKGTAYEQLAVILAAAGRRQDREPQAMADIAQWTRGPAMRSRDGIPAHAFGTGEGDGAGRLRQRDFDLGRAMGLLSADGPPPAATAVLLTLRDGRADWLNAGQALHRLLLRSAAKWVFGSIYTQPLEAAAIRTLIASRLALPGYPQVLLQLGVARTTAATARRSAAEVIES